MQKAKVLLVVLTRATYSSEEVINEIRMALEHKLKIIVYAMQVIYLHYKIVRDHVMKYPDPADKAVKSMRVRAPASRNILPLRPHCLPARVLPPTVAGVWNRADGFCAARVLESGFDLLHSPRTRDVEPAGCARTHLDSCVHLSQPKAGRVAS